MLKEARKIEIFLRPCSSVGPNMLLISIVVLDSAVVRVVQALQQVPLQYSTLTLNIVKHSLSASATSWNKRNKQEFWWIWASCPFCCCEKRTTNLGRMAKVYWSDKQSQSRFMPSAQGRTRRKRSMSSTANGKTWPKAQRPLSVCEVHRLGTWRNIRSTDIHRSKQDSFADPDLGAVAPKAKP